jgi:hypothetical protein
MSYNEAPGEYEGYEAPASRTSIGVGCSGGLGSVGRSERRKQALARIAYAESLGMVRWEPYACIGVRKPRWAFNGSHYDFDELPALPNNGGLGYSHR